jgi:hypothetical protein
MGMRFAVESWSADYGSPTEAAAVLDPSTARVDPWVECDAAEWAPRPPAAAVTPLDVLAFVDGVRRVEATVWITDDAGEVHQGLCASYAAGAVRCDGEARLVAAEVERGLFAPVEGADGIETRHGRFELRGAGSGGTGGAAGLDALSLRLQRAMGDLEARVARAAGDVDAVVVDGPLRAGHRGAGFVGYVKTHHAAYGPPVVRDVIARLDCGERTPLLVLETPVPRYSWYLRLPCEVTHSWAGVVRLEVAADVSVADAATLADRLSCSLPRFASSPQKDPRAPQNLVPIGGLERELRRRLGDPALLLRALRVAAATAAPGTA